MQRKDHGTSMQCARSATYGFMTRRIKIHVSLRGGSAQRQASALRSDAVANKVHSRAVSCCLITRTWRSLPYILPAEKPTMRIPWRHLCRPATSTCDDIVSVLARKYRAAEGEYMYHPACIATVRQDCGWMARFTRIFDSLYPDPDAHPKRILPLALSSRRHGTHRAFVHGENSCQSSQHRCFVADPSPTRS
ncbi:hypothetical protein SPRG_21622 [Saprolegnia parasitica CBS 223.65]|uniref:Uncharacterized protein n=1 Tax=Saprolegnia parasitica (strain CBS 223.65) TaxID=695850 RepID=A0A067BWF1_SAPPC|nr:hypothetical protein SPRG_21622 [Saprolegnia parasitica CBS 223.65]KDO18937.1 hypothetical protein SPRG_21622 [Saprolegnia parasitica CBS 223.65]|eukprot:XP_012210350.1 hypothetical protein SPRG_21622 [Saprolegnia parasitica CBS 223.65]